MKLRQAPYWLDRAPDRRGPPFPRLRSNLDTEVVIVGGGLTGMLCAWSLAAARIPVVVIERDRVGTGATAGGAGLVREDFDGRFGETVRLHGLRAARTLWQAMRRASLEFPAALRRLGARVDLDPRPLLDIAGRDRAGAAALEREYQARRAAGLEHRWMTALNLRREAAVEAAGAIRTAGFVLDPYRACLAALDASVAKGVSVFERSEVLRIRARAKSVEVATEGGTVSAATVVIAGGASISDLRPLRRHLRPRHGYAVVTAPLSAPVKREVGARSAVLRLGADPPQFVRWLPGDRVLVEGADQDPVATRAREQAVVQRSGQLMYELSLTFPAISGTPAEWGWWLPFDDTVDGLPYIGGHRNFPRQLFALGLGRHGATASWLAARILLRQIAGIPAKGDELFSFARILQPH
jgi:glycine/D-amino acid oxidase-like deaminating enzyme